MCNHVRDTLGNLLRVLEQGINQKLLPGAKTLRYLSALKLEYMGKDRKIPSLTVFE